MTWVRADSSTFCQHTYAADDDVSMEKDLNTLPHSVTVYNYAWIQQCVLCLWSGHWAGHAVFLKVARLLYLAV